MLIRILALLLSIFSMSFISQTNSQDCIPYLVATHSSANQSAIYQVLDNDQIEIREADFNTGSIKDTGIRLPRNAGEVHLNPTGETLLYTIGNFTDESLSRDSYEIQFILVEISTGTSEVAYKTTGRPFPSVIDLRWVDEYRFGYISNYENRAYTIVDVRTYIAMTFQPRRKLVSENITLEYSRDFEYFAALTQDGSIRFSDWGNLRFENLIFNPWSLDNYNYAWSPDDRFFLVLSDKQEWYRIDRIDATTDMIGNFGYSLKHPAVSPNGDRIAFRVGMSLPYRSDRTAIGIVTNKSITLLCPVGLIVLSDSGWSNDSHLFAMSIVQNYKTLLLYFDVEKSELFLFDIASDTSTNSRFIGWK